MRAGPGARPVASGSVRKLGLLVLAGSAARIVLMLAFPHGSFDLESHRIVAEALRADPLTAYDTLRWPYPPGYFPLLWISDAASRATGTSLTVWIQLWQVVADGLLVVLIHELMRARGATRDQALLAAGLVALGPTFVIATGYTAQIDSVAILPCVLALLLWERLGPDRAWVAW